MKKTLIIIAFSLGLSSFSAQRLFKNVPLKSPALDETSGLLLYNNVVITHNDSGGNPDLYEVNPETGSVSRTVVVQDATNIDWEDITQDQHFIYVGDIGNNEGNRKDLKIYKISKADYNDGDDTVTPEIIRYYYEDQTDFKSRVNNNNWDAEALISYNDQLLIFTKNWADNQVNVYAVPKVADHTHRAVKVSSYNTKGMITGADVSPDHKKIFLTGYSTAAPPFLFTVTNIPTGSYDVFSGQVSEKKANLLPMGNQVEGITIVSTSKNKHEILISNEKYTVSFGPLTFTFPAKLWSLELENEDVTLAASAAGSIPTFSIYPNPFQNILKLTKKADEIQIYDLAGKLITTKVLVDEIQLGHLQAGTYMARIKMGDEVFIKKLIKK